MHKKVREFNDYRQKMNDKIIASDNKIIKRIFNLDTKAFSCFLITIFDTLILTSYKIRIGIETIT